MEENKEGPWNKTLEGIIIEDEVIVDPPEESESVPLWAKIFFGVSGVIFTGLLAGLLSTYSPTKAEETLANRQVQEQVNPTTTYKQLPPTETLPLGLEYNVIDNIKFPVVDDPGEIMENRFVLLDYSNVEYSKSFQEWNGLEASDYIELNGIPFVFNSQLSTRCTNVNKNNPINFLLDMDKMPAPERIHVLLHAGEGWKEYEGESIARIGAHFISDVTLLDNLYLGKDIRDWALDNEKAITHLDYQDTFSAWVGDNGEGMRSTLDLHTFELPGIDKGDKLDSITIADYLSEDSTTPHSPCIYVLGITLDYYESDGSESTTNYVQPTATSEPTTSPPYDSEGVWFDQENPTASVIEKSVKEGEILFISAGGFIEGDNRCDYATLNEQICIYIKEIAKDDVLIIENLVPGQALISRIRDGTIEGVLKGTEPYFWKPENCGDGCSWARVIREYANGCVEKFILYPNNYPPRDYQTDKCE